MKSKLLFEVETLREMVQASIEALNACEPLTSYGEGYRDARADVLKHLDRILEEVSE